MLKNYNYCYSFFRKKKKIQKKSKVRQIEKLI